MEPLLKCRRLYKYQRLDGYYSPRSSWKMRWGTAMHKAIEVMLTAKLTGASKDDAVAQALIAVADEYGDLRDSDINSTNFATLYRAVVWYAEQYYAQESIDTVVLEDGEPAIELHFDVPLTDTDRFEGRMDRVGYFDGDLAIVDSKTTETALSDSYFLGHFPTIQTIGYTWALRRQLGLPVKHYIIDGVQTGVGFTRFARRRLPDISDEHTDEWYRMVVDAVTNVGEYLPNFAACYGCNFRQVCAQSTELMRQITLDADYVKRESKR